ncbi:MAG: phosphate acyltransferase PlsX [Ruminococcaceae bacterium]|nr:phosphate acyltransferase PlsX [Oscillospiraceae bacterium]
MKIIVDAFGGDNAPEEIVKGAAAAAQEYSLEIALVGDADKIKACIKKNNISQPLEIIHADDVMTMEDEPTSILKAKSGSSMAVGLKALASGRGDAFVSAGNTGALLAGASLLVKRIRGIKRAAIATVLPKKEGCFMLLDCGATVDAKPEYLSQYGLMGSVYMQKVMGVESPKVALLNNGTEECKGTQLHIDAHALLKEEKVNFIGNIEGREAILGDADVIVADGFSGNIFLKAMEGMGNFISGSLKNVLYSSLKTKLSALIMKKELNSFKAQLDYKEYGGAPLLGIRKPVIKAHGSSDAKAIKSAIRQAKKICDVKAIEKISQIFEAD